MNFFVFTFFSQVCGHLCREPCGMPCLCRLPCETSCSHSRCGKRCGEPCSPCTEPCARQCPHSSCTALCSHECSAEPCTQPCSRLLQCGHPCIGLCGDPCPYQCSSCGTLDVPVLFGKEDEEGARFVQLVDCSHLIHAESLDEWVRGGITESRVQLPECPLCKTPIRRTQRYTSIINRHLGHVEKVKEKLRGEKSSDHRQSVIREITAELKVQLAKKKSNNTGRSGDVFSKKKSKFMVDLVRSVTSAEAALGVPQLRNCQQLLQSVCIMISLGSQSSELNVTCCYSLP